MAKVKIAGTAMVLTSSLKFSEIEAVLKHRPEKAKLRNESLEPVFAVNTACTGSGELNKFSATFVRGLDDQACVTIMVGAKTKEQIADEYGAAIIKLRKLEEQLAAEVIGVTRDLEAVMACIEA